MAVDTRSDPDHARPSLRNAIVAVAGKESALASFSLTGLFLIAVFAVLHSARELFVPLVVALLLSLLFRPLVRAFERVFVPRALGGALVILGVLAAIALGAFKLSEPAVAWSAKLPKALRLIEAKSKVLRRPVDEVSALAERVEKLTDVGSAPGVREVRVAEPGLASAALEVTLELAAGAVVLLFALYFLLIWGDAFLSRLVRLVPDLRDQKRAEHVIREVEGRMSTYLLTITLINAGLGAALALVLGVLGMPNPILWGVLAAVLTYIPYLGAMVGIVVVALASLVAFPSLSDAVLPPLAYAVLASIEGNVVTPVVVGRTFRVDPIVVFVWLVFWAWLWGVPGAVVAVPLLMLVKITCEQSKNLAPIAEFLSR